MRKYRTLFLLIAVSLLPLVSFFITSDNPHTHDGFVHLVRIAAYFKALRDGQIFPRWTGDLNYGYGMPLFNFIYQFPYLVASAFVALGSSLVLAFKLTMAISYILGAIGIYLFADELFNDKKITIIVSLLYQFAPFRLIELLVRGSFGELYTYAFLPFVLWGLTKLSKKPNLFYFSVTSLFTGLLIISHNSISLVFFAVAAFFVIVFAKPIKNLFWGLSALAGGLIVSSWYWVPALLEHKYTLGDLYMRDLFRSHFPPLINFFIPNFNNSVSLQTKGISVQFGLFHVIAILLAILYIFGRKKIPTLTKTVLFGFIVILGSLFIMQPVSIFLWSRLPLLRQFQFPWRLLAPVTLATAILGALYTNFSLFKQKTVFILTLILIVLSTAFYWKPPLGYDHIASEASYWNYPLDTTYFGETDVIWSAGPAKSYPPSRIQIIEGTATITKFVKGETIHTFNIDATVSSKLVDNTLYFPGWTVYVDNNKVPIQFQDPNWRGLITFSVPSGTHSIIVQFEDTKDRSITKILSAGACLSLLIVALFSWKKRYA